MAKGGGGDASGSSKGKKKGGKGKGGGGGGDHGMTGDSTSYKETVLAAKQQWQDSIL